jgi:hypothetical protein
MIAVAVSNVDVRQAFVWIQLLDPVTRALAWIVVRRGSTRTVSWAEEIHVADVGDQRGVMLSGIGTGGTAGIAGVRKTSARRSIDAVLERMNVVKKVAVFIRNSFFN